MGNVFRTRTRLAPSNNTNTTNSTTENSNQDIVAENSNSTNMADSDDSMDNPEDLRNPDGDLGQIISFLLRSGQVRLVRSGGVGAFEVDMPGLTDEESSDDDSEVMPTRQVSPRGDTAPDTSNIDKSDLRNILLSDSGAYYSEPTNITKRIYQCQNSSLPYGRNFNRSDYIKCNSSFLPNSCTIVESFRSKAFCGTYSEDGSVFMSACQDQHIRLYDTTNGQFKLFRDIPAKDVGWSIVDTAYSPDQNYIIYSSWSEFIHLCNVYGDHETHLALDLRPDSSRFCAFSVSFSHDSKEIVAGGSDHGLYVYGRECDQRILRITAHDDDVNTVQFAEKSSNILISGSDDGLCKVWDRRDLSEKSPKPVGTFAGHVNGITYVSSKDDGVHFISNSKDQSIKLWDIRKFSGQETIKEAKSIVRAQSWDYRWPITPRRSQRLKKGHCKDAIMTYRGHRVLHTLLRAKFSPTYATGQQYIYAGCATGSVVIYDVLTGQVVKKLKDVHRSCVRDVSWHPYQNTIMSSSWDCKIGKWEFNRVDDCEFGNECPSAIDKRKKMQPLKRRRIDSLR